MNIVQIKVNVHHGDTSDTTAVPVAVPDLDAVRALAEQLHRAGEEYQGSAWGWSVQYDSEVHDDAALFDIPDGQGYRTEVRPFWSPASFTIGESGIWFYSLLWEHGVDEVPAAFLDDRNVLTSVAD